MPKQSLAQSQARPTIDDVSVFHYDHAGKAIYFQVSFSESVSNVLGSHFALESTKDELTATNISAAPLGTNLSSGSTWRIYASGLTPADGATATGTTVRLKVTDAAYGTSGIRNRHGRILSKGSYRDRSSRSVDLVSPKVSIARTPPLPTLT